MEMMWTLSQQSEIIANIAGKIKKKKYRKNRENSPSAHDDQLTLRGVLAEASVELTGLLADQVGETGHGVPDGHSAIWAGSTRAGGGAEPIDVVGTASKGHSSPGKLVLQFQQAMQFFKEGRQEDVATDGADPEAGVLQMDVDDGHLVVPHMAAVVEGVRAGAAPGEFPALVIHAEIEVGAANTQIASFALSEDQHHWTLLGPELIQKFDEVSGFDVLGLIVMLQEVEGRRVAVPGSRNQDVIPDNSWRNAKQ